MRILGIDPGLSGGAAIFVTGGDLDGPRRVWGLIELPVAGEGHHRHINVEAMREFIVVGRPDFCAMENAHTMPKQGIASAFRYGRAVGELLTVVRLCHVPHRLIEPQAWKKYHRLMKSDKEASRQRALELCPGAAPHLSRKKDHGRAEALLISIYGAKLLWDDGNDKSFFKDEAQKEMGYDGKNRTRSQRIAADR